ncbi:glycoside hydrolase family 2 protein [Xylariaceae sp. FL0255]|nr:glycoside hydrolase family 2 protein [Xylariaceae sp. FL0255]
MPGKMGFVVPSSYVSLRTSLASAVLLLSLAVTARTLNYHDATSLSTSRQVTRLDTDWKFQHFFSNPDNITYDALKAYILPSGNDFIANVSDRHERPAEPPEIDIEYAKNDFDDRNWDSVKVPHDWAIKGPFYTGNNTPVDGSMGYLPVQGVGWYRRKITIEPSDRDKTFFLDIDGAMSYAMVWMNGQLVGGWPYGYNAFRLDLTPYLTVGTDNQLSIRLYNPTLSSRWYPGGGLYRNVWLIKVNKLHVSHWGTFITSRDISVTSATLDLIVRAENTGDGQDINVITHVNEFDATTGDLGKVVATFPQVSGRAPTNETIAFNMSVKVSNPRLWGPWPAQSPNKYIATTTIYSTDNHTVYDTYTTSFGVREVSYDPDQGLLVNGQHVRIQGVNQHHDLGAIGAAFNTRAAERQLEILREMGTNAIRTSHNPPAPELLDLVDRMGFLVFAEIFDCWEIDKNVNDFHLIFDDWHEPDLRAYLRRERNHPSIYIWSVGNEVGEQYTNATGAAIGKGLVDIAHEEDPTRLVTASMNYAKPDMDFPTVFDVLSLNYQGEGIRNSPAYAGLTGIITPPLYDAFHEAFPGKMVQSSETSSTLSSRGTYIFPVTSEISAPVNDTSGGNSTSLQVSSYELYTADFGASPDKVFAAQDQHPFVAGEFVWSGFDYIGEPTPYAAARSAYSGIIDLAGFPKDRFYLYQSRWRPDVRSAHILPHWTWPDRVGLVTPVHVFSAADEAELFVNNASQGRLTRDQYTYRFRWDDVVYAPGDLRVITYKNGTIWAEATTQTVGSAVGIHLRADRDSIRADGNDLVYITAEVIDGKGRLVPQATNGITFDVSGPGVLLATDNGDQADFTAFPSKERNAFSGLVLAIVQSLKGRPGSITISASGENLKATTLIVKTE